jgi:two-component system, LytTR family, response regulator LytT
MKVLIVEDEPLAQVELERLLKKVAPDVEILDKIDSVEDGIEWFELNPSPDLVFLDIQLSDGLSFEIFKKVKINAPVIFTTAFNEYALEAFKLNSIDYLLKPIEPEGLKLAIEKYKGIKEQFSSIEFEDSIKKVREMLNYDRKDYKKRFVSKIGDQYLKIDVNDVAYFQADNNIVYLVTKNSKRHIIEYTLEELNDILDPSLFFRLNRTFITQIGSIQKVHKYFNSRLKIDLIPEPDDKILVSRVKVSEFLKWMDN